YQRAARALEAPAEPETSDVLDRDAEQYAVVYQAVRALPSDQRRVIELRFAAEQSIAEIARVLGRTEGAVNHLQLRALQTPRGRLDAADAWARPGRPPRRAGADAPARRCRLDGRGVGARARGGGAAQATARRVPGTTGRHAGDRRRDGERSAHD